MAHALFVCLHNAGRSQMSQALLERAAEGRDTAASAGTQPGERLHRQVFDAMTSASISIGFRRTSGPTGDRAKDPFLWPDPSRNGRKLAENPRLRPGATVAKSQQASQIQGLRAPGSHPGGRRFESG
jgi:Low molecular weight phosphotyrosine protein phosphatase